MDIIDDTLSPLSITRISNGVKGGRQRKKNDIMLQGHHFHVCFESKQLQRSITISVLGFLSFRISRIVSTKAKK